jgi:CHAT domain-containing protein
MSTGGAATLALTILGAAPSHSFRGKRPGCSDFQSLRFEYLPGALREVTEISELWDKALRTKSGSSASTDAIKTSPGRSLILSEQAATEKSVKTLSSGHQVLHLATHGFFLEDRCAAASNSRDEAQRGVGGVATAGGQATPVSSENPLLLSGLALAGANRHDTVGPDEEDGILTAEEIASLDLSGTECAVLSACETGVGQVRASEGVLGLRRAFQIAGARTVIMSLWSVEDESTSRWMREFYDARLSDDLSTAEAAREASLSVLRARRARGQKDGPLYWGAFVATGDWR